MRAAEFVRRELFNEAGGALFRSWCGRRGGAEGFAEDYAFFVQGLLDLYEATFEVRWLQWAERLQESMDRRFWDEEGGGYFNSAAGASDIVLRLKEDYDGAEPAPNSVAAMNLAAWGRSLTDRKAHRPSAGTGCSASSRLSGPAGGDSPALPQMLCALELAAGAAATRGTGGGPGVGGFPGTGRCPRRGARSAAERARRGRRPRAGMARGSGAVDRRNAPSSRQGDGICLREFHLPGSRHGARTAAGTLGSLVIEWGAPACNKIFQKTTGVSCMIPARLACAPWLLSPSFRFSSPNSPGASDSAPFLRLFGSVRVLHMNDIPSVRTDTSGGVSPKDFTTFMRAYQDMVFTTALRLVSNEAQAEDISQDVFLKAYEHFDGPEG